MPVLVFGDLVAVSRDGASKIVNWIKLNWIKLNCFA